MPCSAAAATARRQRHCRLANPVQDALCNAWLLSTAAWQVLSRIPFWMPGLYLAWQVLSTIRSANSGRYVLSIASAMPGLYFEYFEYWRDRRFWKGRAVMKNPPPAVRAGGSFDRTRRVDVLGLRRPVPCACAGHNRLIPGCRSRRWPGSTARGQTLVGDRR